MLSKTKTIDGGDEERAGLPSASSMPRYAACAGSRAMEQGLPEPPSDSTQETGVNVHAAMETGDDSDLEMDEKDIAAKLREFEEREVASWREDFSLGTPIVIREQRMWIRDRKTLDPVASARPDVVFTSGVHGAVVNYKSGFAQQTPSDRNWQCRTEVIALWHEHPDLEHIRGAILASRLNTKFDATDYDVNDLRRIETELRHILWRTQQSDAPRVPGAHCRWCKARGVCREAAVYGMIVQADMPLAKGKPDQIDLLARVARMSPAELAFVHERRATMDIVFGAVEHALKQLPKDTLESVGYKLVDGNKNYPIPDEIVPTAWQKLLEVLSEEERIQTIKITRGKVETLLRDKEGLTKDAAKERVIKLLGLQEKIGNHKLKKI